MLYIAAEHRQQEAATPCDTVVLEEHTNQQKVSSSKSSINTFASLQDALETSVNDASGQGSTPTFLATPASFLPAAPFQLAIRDKKSRHMDIEKEEELYEESAATF